MSDRVTYYKAIAVLPKHMHVEVSCSTHRCTSRQQQSQSEDPIPTLPQTCCVQFILVLHDAQHCPGFAAKEQRCRGRSKRQNMEQPTNHGACFVQGQPPTPTNIQQHPGCKHSSTIIDGISPLMLPFKDGVI